MRPGRLSTIHYKRRWRASRYSDSLPATPSSKQACWSAAFYNRECPPKTTDREALDVLPPTKRFPQGAQLGKTRWSTRPPRSAKVAILDSGGPTRWAPNPGSGHFGGCTVVEPVGIDRFHCRTRREQVRHILFIQYVSLISHGRKQKNVLLC